jgi:tRNA A-37 threonylcarbamoyl transferase component Bud32
MSVSSPYLYVAVALGLTMRFRRTLGATIDRKFFREAYDRERLLMELVGRIDRLDSFHEITALVGRELDAAFHPSSVYLWLHQEGRMDGPLESASGDSLFNLRSDSALVRQLEAGAEVQAVPFENEKLNNQPDVQALIQHRVVLIVPLVGTSGRLQGLMFLGEKKSEEPYSGRDRQLLQAIAKQIAVVRENQALNAHVRHEQRIRHEILGRLDKQAVNLLQECPLCGTCYDRARSHCEQDGTALTTPLPVERVLAGRYRLERLLGRGAMGAVYEASDLGLKRAVAVKIMVARSFGDPAALRRFEREARLVASLSHPNVVAVYDYGTLAADGAFIVMEVVRGVTWRAALASQRRFHPQMLVDCVAQLCAGLGAAHHQRIIHRDLKPENVLIAAGDGCQRVIRVVDFGIAKHVSETAPTTVRLTLQGAAIGTIGYMAPEQLAGRSIDQRVDVFAAGVMTWEALVGERPFRGTTVEEVMLSMSRPVPDLPIPGEEKALCRILRSAIACNVAERIWFQR